MATTFLVWQLGAERSASPRRCSIDERRRRALGELGPADAVSNAGADEDGGHVDELEKLIAQVVVRSPDLGSFRRMAKSPTQVGELAADLSVTDVRATSGWSLRRTGRQASAGVVAGRTYDGGFINQSKQPAPRRRRERKVLGVRRTPQVRAWHPGFFSLNSDGRCARRYVEKQMKSSLKDQDMVLTHLELCKVYLKMDQPNTARQCYGAALAKHPGDINLILGTVRFPSLLFLS